MSIRLFVSALAAVTLGASAAWADDRLGTDGSAQDVAASVLEQVRPLSFSRTKAADGHTKWPDRLDLMPGAWIEQGDDIQDALTAALAGVLAFMDSNLGCVLSFDEARDAAKRGAGLEDDEAALASNARTRTDVARRYFHPDSNIHGAIEAWDRLDERASKGERVECRLGAGFDRIALVKARTRGGSRVDVAFYVRGWSANVTRDGPLGAPTIFSKETRPDGMVDWHHGLVMRKDRSWRVHSSTMHEADPRLFEWPHRPQDDEGAG